MTFARFDRYVDRHAQSFAERLQALCRMPSVAARGTGMRAMVEAVEQAIAESRNRTRLFKMGTGYPIVYGECGSGPSYLVYGHYDVQPVVISPTGLLAHSPVHFRWKKLYARGAANSKGDPGANCGGGSVSKTLQTARSICASFLKVKMD